MVDTPKSWNILVNDLESKDIIKEWQHVKISEELAGELAIAVSQLENKIPEPIDMDVHEYVETKKYLQHAPEEFKALWKTATPADQEVYKKHVEFTVDGPNIIGASGKEYKLAKENLTVSNKDLKKWKIDRYKWETYFDWEALRDYTDKHKISVPTEDMYLDMLKVMPAWDVTKKYVWWVTWRQLFSVLWGKLNGYFSEGNYIYNDTGYLWSASYGIYDCAFALISGDTKGVLYSYYRGTQCPARFLRTPK